MANTDLSTRYQMSTLGTQQNLPFFAPQHFHRHVRRAAVPDSKLWYTMTTPEAGDSNCLFAIPNVDGSGPYPVRFKSCDPLEDDSLWQFVPDSQGHYFIYNKGWGSSGHRLDINCPEPSMCIMWMGPSGEIYNNQRWFLGGSNGQFKISSLGLPGSSLSSALVDNNYVGVMLDTTTISDDSKNWKLGVDIPASSSSTTPASSIAPASTVAPAPSITPSPSVDLSRLDNHIVSSTPAQTEGPSSTLIPNTPESDNPGMSSTVAQHEKPSTTLASDAPEFSNPTASPTTGLIGGPSASDTSDTSKFDNSGADKHIGLKPHLGNTTELAVLPVAEPVRVTPVSEPETVPPVSEPETVPPVSEPEAVPPVIEPVRALPTREPAIVVNTQQPLQQTHTSKMFSEYASRFLAQSQSRISSFVQPPESDAGSVAPSRARRSSRPLASTGRADAGRSALGNPYQGGGGGQLSGFPFASRLSAAPDAPLFHSALDEFREEDDEEERERDLADFYALQRSRRVVGARMEESEETEREGGSTVELSREEERGLGRGRGIKSSWHGGRGSVRERGQEPETLREVPEGIRYEDSQRRTNSDASSNDRGRMVDIGLESAIDDNEPPDDLTYEAADDSPPAFQQFRTPESGPGRMPDSKIFHGTRDLEAAMMDSTRPPSVVSTVPATMGPMAMGELPKHDVFWGSLYLIGLAALFSTFFLVFLHTSTPSSTVDTVVAVIISLLWLALLRSFVRPLVYILVVAVPVILFSFSLYPLISSYKGVEHGTSIQDRAMRWLSFVPLLTAIIWSYTVFQGRHSLHKAVGILEFSSRILAANPALLTLGFATLAAVILWTWLWLAMFTRVFLGGHLVSSIFIIDFATWWLGAFFVLMYLWTLSVLSGLQRVATAATVSQWYFHRNAAPAPSSRDIVVAGLTHASTTQFGTICLATLLALAIRLPVLLLPRRLLACASLFAYNLIPSPVASLTNPLNLTNAGIQSQPHAPPARALSHMTYLGLQGPTSTLAPRPCGAWSHGYGPLLPYRLAKLLLHATRCIMAVSLGFGGGVATARQLEVAGSKGVRGSV
ncbi:hypothetical protein VE04_05565, partial [Pseudogymnoascus sp. 24MN13]